MAAPASRVSRVLMTGPLAPFADAYRTSLRERGYTPLTTVNELRQMAWLSRWLEANRLTAADLSSERAQQFLAYRRAQGQRATCSRPCLIWLLDLLRGLGVTAAEVTQAVLRESRAVSVSAAQNFVCALRSFLRFCFIEGLLEADLSQAALPVTGRRRSSLPKGIGRADAEALLGACDRRQALGRRDYALIILLLRLGLRRGEVARLRLEDIDWRAGELVVRGKGAREDRLPLAADVGEAIASYLRRGRHASDRRELFLQARAPYEPIASGTVASTVRRACRRAEIPEVGSHRLRHTTACEMVSAGVPLQRIGQVLRHRSLQSTAIYARVDLDRLRLLAQPWPQGGMGR